MGPVQVPTHILELIANYLVNTTESKYNVIFTNDKDLPTMLQFRVEFATIIATQYLDQDLLVVVNCEQLNDELVIPMIINKLEIDIRRYFDENKNIRFSGSLQFNSRGEVIREVLDY